MPNEIKTKETFNKLTFLQGRLTARMQRIKVAMQYGTPQDAETELKAVRQIVDEVEETLLTHFEDQNT